MAGNKIGGQKAAAKNLAKDPDFYKKIGSIGGSKGNTGGWATELVGTDGLTGRERASVAGRLGGLKSRRKSTYA